MTARSHPLRCGSPLFFFPFLGPTAIHFKLSFIERPFTALSWCVLYLTSTASSADLLHTKGFPSY
jgi:hypothetical protein